MLSQRLPLDLVERPLLRQRGRAHADLAEIEQQTRLAGHPNLRQRAAYDFRQLPAQVPDPFRSAGRYQAAPLQGLHDLPRLQQIVWNLLSNAIKFTPNGGRVDIVLESVGEQAQIIVKDTGKGIHPDFLPHLFESFRQQDASTTRKFGGLGVGLSIVRYLVEAHGGTVTADSLGEGQGATFTVQLPLLKEDNSGSLTPVSQDPEPSLRGIRVLAVDDEPDARELLAAVLKAYGAEVKIAASATEALVVFRGFQPDVLVSDIGMPDLDGYTLLQRIQALLPSDEEEIQAIALTAYAGPENQKLAFNCGYHAHITKPLEPEQLVDAIAVLTSRGDGGMG
ncbi:MAG: response regulator [Kamptonema sp. SIO4C4]|nr:response regulator [Kamptonema sp. SIO4C4]